MFLRSYFVPLCVACVVFCIDYSSCPVSQNSDVKDNGGGLGGQYYRNGQRRPGSNSGRRGSYGATSQDCNYRGRQGSRYTTNEEPQNGQRRPGSDSGRRGSYGRTSQDCNYRGRQGSRYTTYEEPQYAQPVPSHQSEVYPSRTSMYGSRGQRRTRPRQFGPISCPSEESIHYPGEEGVILHIRVPNKKEEFVIVEKQPGDWDRRDIRLLVANGFDVNKPTLIYMGGWMQMDEVYWLKTARSEYDRLASKNGGEAPYNLLVFDWYNYSYLIYSTSVSYVPHVSVVLATLVEVLVDEHGYKAEQVHIISYSLSTHIAGRAARLVQEHNRGVVGQITAIDPTGVCFHGTEDSIFEREIGLRPTDARLVVARHYNMQQLGSRRPIGGLDIIVNGGGPDQPVMRPGIRVSDPKEYAGYLGVGIGAHQRAVQHEEIRFEVSSSCHEIAYECSDQDKFMKGQCADCGRRNESCFLISTLGNIVVDQRPPDVGYKLGTQMHITTGFDRFCLHHYQVVAQLRPQPTVLVLQAFDEGRFSFELAPELVVMPRYRLDEGGVRYTQLIRLEDNISRFPKQINVRRVDTELIYSVESISINFMSHISAEKRANGSVRYCPDESGNLLVECTKKRRKSSSKQ